MRTHLSIYCAPGLRLALAVVALVMSVHELSEELSGMSGGIEVVGVHVSLTLAALLAAVPGVDVLVVIVVKVLVLVEMGF